MMGREHPVRVDELDGELRGLLPHLRVELELDVDVGVERLGGLDGVSPVEHDLVVLDHAQPGGLRIPPGTRRILHTLHRRTLSYIRTGAIQPRLLVVPEREPDGTVRPDVGRGEDARDLENEGRARGVVVDRISPAPAVHVRAEDVHLVGRAHPDLRGVDLLARLSEVLVAEPLCRIAPAPELLLDPVDRSGVPLGSLPTVSELGELLDEQPVVVHVEPRHDLVGHAVGGRHRHASENPARDRPRSGRLAEHVGGNDPEQRGDDEHPAQGPTGRNLLVYPALRPQRTMHGITPWLRRIPAASPQRTVHSCYPTGVWTETRHRKPQHRP